MNSRRMLIIILAAVAVIAIITRLPMRAAEPAPAVTTYAAASPSQADQQDSTSAGTATASASPAGGDATATHPSSTPAERPVIPAGSGEPMDTTDVDTASADAVADAVAGQAASADVRTDTSWADGARRAAPLMTDDLAETASAEIPGGRDALWLDLEAHDGYTKVRVEAGEDSATPPDTTTQAMRIRIVTVTLLGRDGWEGTTQTTAYYLTLTMTDDGWRVSEMTASTYTDS